MSDIEVRLLSKIINRRDLSQALKSGIKIPFFHADNRDVWKYVTEYYSEHGVVPHKDVIARTFPKFGIVSTASEPYTALLEEIKEREQYNKVRETIEEAGKLLVNSTSDDAYKRIIQGISEIAMTIRDTEDADWLKNADERIESYDKRSKQTQFGIPFPWAGLNDMILGMQDSHLITIAARPTVGKSWFMALCAYHAWAKGHNVLFITKEMAVEEIERRLDAIHTVVPYMKFRKAKLESADRAQFEKGLKTLAKGTTTTINVTGAEVADGGVMSLSAKIDEYNPDIVFVDGVYLLSDDRGGKSKTEQLYNITQDMKRLARRFKIPVVQTCQLKRGTHDGKRGADPLASMSFSDSFGQDSDDVIMINKEPDVPGVMYIEVVKSREGEVGMVKSMWNAAGSPMVYTEIKDGEAERLNELAKTEGEDPMEKLDDSEYDATHRKPRLKLKIAKSATVADPNEV